MITLLRITIIVTTILITTGTALCQSLSVSIKSITPYPTITADFLALDKDALPFSSISVKDVKVTENGIQQKIVSVTCPPTNTPLPVSVVLTFDISGSMNFYGGERYGTGDKNIDVAKRAGITFLNALQLPPSECAVTSFNNFSYLNSDFTDSRANLISTVNQITPPVSAGTFYYPAFMDPDFGAIAVASRGQYQSKAIIFLTDGDGKDRFFNTAAVINAANNAGVKVFCIGLRMPLGNDLISIAQQTGGDWFTDVRTAEQAEAIYRRIVQKIQGYAPCEIVWETSGCDTRRTVVLEYLPVGLKDTVTYTVPDTLLSQLTVSPLGTAFGTVAISTNSDTTVYLKAKNGITTVSGLTISDPRFTIVSPTVFPIDIPNNDSIPVIIRFTPTDTKYAYAELTAISTACNLTIGYFSGGSESDPPLTPTLRIIHPNGKERFLWRSDTIITWRGVLPQDTVTLEFSIDNGKTWILITDKATGLLHKWKVPATPSKECLMRVTQQVKSGYKPYASIKLPAAVKDIIFSPDASKFYVLSADSVIRQYNTTNAANNYTINGARALYMGLNTDGTWLAVTNRIDSTRRVSIYSSTSAPLFNIGIKDSLISKCLFQSTDTIVIPARLFGGFVFSRITSTQNSLLYTETENGLIEWADIAPQQGLYLSISPAGQRATVFNLWRRTKEIIALPAPPVRGAIAKDGSSVLTTDINGVLRLWNSQSKQSIIPTTDKMLSTAYHPNGLFAIAGGITNTRVNQNNQNENYAIAQLFSMTGGKIGVLDTHTQTITSVAVANDGTIATGGNDSTLFLWKIQIAQSDVSDEVWEIVAPELTVENVFMDSVEVNNSRDSLVQLAIKNTGTVSTIIRSVTITGTDAQDFAVTVFTNNTVLQPGETMPLEFGFSPTAIGLRTAIIEVNADDYTKTADISGEGILLGLEAIPIIDFGKRFLGDTKDTVVKAVLKNTGTISLRFAAARFIVPFNSQFTFIAPPADFTLKAQDSVEVQLRFSPIRLGRVMTILEYGFNRSGSPKIIRVMGEGICAGGADSVIAKADKKSAIPGDTISVAVKLHYPVGAIQSTTRPYRMEFDYDTTVLKLLTPITSQQFDSRLTSADTVQFFKFLVLLGMDDTAKVFIKAFDWGTYCAQSPSIVDAKVPIEICRAGGDRLFNPNAQGLAVNVSPNPPKEKSTITFNTPENGITSVEVFSMLGEKMATLYNSYIQAGTYSFEIPISSLPVGTYYITVHTPTQQKTIIVPIQ